MHHHGDPGTQNFASMHNNVRALSRGDSLFIAAKCFYCAIQPFGKHAKL